MGCDSSCTCEKDERERWIEALEELGFHAHPGVSVKENLFDFAKQRSRDLELQLEEFKKWIREDGHNHCEEPTPENWFWDDCTLCKLQKSEGKVWKNGSDVPEKRVDEGGAK